MYKDKNYQEVLKELRAIREILEKNYKNVEDGKLQPYFLYKAINDRLEVISVLLNRSVNE